VLSISASGIARATMVTPSIPGSSAGGTTIGPGPGPFALDGSYVAEARRLARRQAALAAARLANLLDEALRGSDNLAPP